MILAWKKGNGLHNRLNRRCWTLTPYRWVCHDGNKGVMGDDGNKHLQQVTIPSPWRLRHGLSMSYGSTFDTFTVEIPVPTLMVGSLWGCRWGDVISMGTSRCHPTRLMASPQHIYHVTTTREFFHHGTLMTAPKRSQHSPMTISIEHQRIFPAWKGW